MSNVIGPISRFADRNEMVGDLIKGYRICAALDLLTRPICRSLDGKIFPAGEGPRPPFYKKCRCCAVPVAKSFRELAIDLPDLPTGERATMTGPVPADWTYYDWLTRQPSHAIEGVLGRTRARLLVFGGLTPGQFADLQVNQQLKPRSLSQMRVLEPGAFAVAGL
jgi:hypothetical protein